MQEPPKSRLKMELDRISDLPNDVLEKILLLLPIRETVRTSVLSNKWRYKWAMLPHLVFDGRDMSVQNYTNFVRTVDHVLLLHRGSINKFVISHQTGLTARDIDRWIFHLSKHSIEEFILKPSFSYKIPSCLFAWQHMTHLSIKNCSLKPHPTFRGFRSLKRLEIIGGTFAQDVLENLIVSSPLLVELILKVCVGFARLKIDNPNLQLLDIEGKGNFDVILENTINVVMASIRLNINVDQIRVHQSLVPESSSNLVLFFLHLPQIQTLRIDNYLLKYLAVGVRPIKVSKFPKPCLHLKKLSLEIQFSDLDEIITALWLLNSSSALQELEIVALPEDGVVVGGVEHRVPNVICKRIISELICDLIWPFPELQLVKITNISGVKAELDMIRSLLISSPVLKRMTVKPSSVEGSMELLKKLVRFERASTCCQIIYLDP